MTKKYVLRDMPGIQSLEALLARIASHPNPKHAPELDIIDTEVALVCEALFGLRPLEPGPLPEDHPMLAFFVEELPAQGWDLTDGEGHLLRSVPYLAPVIAMVVSGHGGHLPDEPHEPPETELRAFEAHFQAAAEKFRRSR